MIILVLLSFSKCVFYMEFGKTHLCSQPFPSATEHPQTQLHAFILRGVHNALKLLSLVSDRVHVSSPWSTNYSCD